MFKSRPGDPRGQIEQDPVQLLSEKCNSGEGLRVQKQQRPQQLSTDGYVREGIVAKTRTTRYILGLMVPHGSGLGTLSESQATIRIGRENEANDEFE